MCEVPGELSQAALVHRADLLHQDPGCLPAYVSLRAERCRSSAPRSWGHDHNGSGQELVSLDDNSVTVAVLFLPNAQLGVLQLLARGYYFCGRVHYTLSIFHDHPKTDDTTTEL